MRVYSANDQEIGFAVASGTTTLVTTNGALDLPDNAAYSVSAKQYMPGSFLYESFPVSANLNIDTVAPRVTNVIISSTVSNPYGTNPAHEFDEFDGSEDQLRTVQVGGANRIAVQFSEDVDILQGDLELSALSRVVAEPSSTFVAPTLANNFTATWTFASQLPYAQHLIRLSDIEDLAGNALDGEWTNPGTVLSSVTTSTFPSGDGVAGGAFEFVFTILPDANRDNFVGSADSGPVLLNWGQTARTFAQGDYTGNGVVSQADQDSVLLSPQWGMNLKLLKLYANFDSDHDVGSGDETTFLGYYNSQNSQADLDDNGIVNQADYDAFYDQLGTDLSVIT